METLTALGNHSSAELPPPTSAVGRTENFDLVVLGGDPLAEVAAREAARLGARVGWFTGTSPDVAARRTLKSWIASARAAYQVHSAQEYGVEVSDWKIDFSEVLARATRVRAQLERTDALDNLRSLGVFVHHQAARFTGPHSLLAETCAVQFRRAILAPGTRPAAAPLRGLAEIGHRDRFSLLELTELPTGWIILGSGPTACECAQLFRRLGCEVHLVAATEPLLPHEEPHAAELVRRQFEREGINLHLGWRPIFAERLGGAKAVTIERQTERLKIFAAEILDATGEVPDVDHLGLEVAGVDFDAAGVAVDELLRTSNHAVFALGSVCASTDPHAAAHACLVVRNALVLGRFRGSRWQSPRVIDTQPTVARLGLTRAAAAEQNIPVETFRLELAEIEGAVLGGQVDGFAAIHVERGTDRIVGATIVAEHASELIGEVALAMNRRLGLRALANACHGELSSAALVSQLATRARPRRLTPQLAGWLKKWFIWRRGRNTTSASNAG